MSKSGKIDSLAGVIPSPSKGEEVWGCNNFSKSDFVNIGERAKFMLLTLIA